MELTILLITSGDHINTVLTMRKASHTARWDEKLDASAQEMRWSWDHSKDWEGKGKHLGVYIQDERLHWKERTRKARAAWELVRRLRRLPPSCKKQIVCGQLLPILTYGSECHPKPTEQMVRLSREWSRWVVGAWRGSNAGKVEDLSGIDKLEGAMRRKKIRWAASVYGRALSALRPIAEKIPRRRSSRKWS